MPGKFTMLNWGKLLGPWTGTFLGDLDCVQFFILLSNLEPKRKRRSNSIFNIYNPGLKYKFCEVTSGKFITISQAHSRASIILELNTLSVKLKYLSSELTFCQCL